MTLQILLNLRINSKVYFLNKVGKYVKFNLLPDTVKIFLILF